jgi:hypothetical protein
MTFVVVSEICIQVSDALSGQFRGLETQAGAICSIAGRLTQREDDARERRHAKTLALSVGG